MQIIDFNPWWKSSEVPNELTGRHRSLLPKLISYLDYRQIILLYGIRRAGKTTLITFLPKKKYRILTSFIFHLIYKI